MPEKNSEQYFERMLDLAEPTALTQGEELFVDQRVVSVRHAQGRLRAVVEDGEGYPVVIDARGALDYSCECSEALTGVFCKHLVAAALQWASEPAAKKGTRKPKADPTAAVRRALGLLGKEEIISQLLDWSREDADLRERLDLLAARTSGRRIKTTPYKKAIRAATQARKRLGLRQSNQAVDRVRRMLAELRVLLDQGAAPQVIDLAELAADCIMRMAPRLDYRSAAKNPLLEEARDLHIEACQEEQPDPRVLAAVLYKWEMSGWEAFQDSVGAYGRILGESGRREFCTLAEREWDGLPALRPGDQRYDYDYGSSSPRSRLAELLKRQARAEEDVDRLVEVCKKDLSSPSNYHEIAGILRDADRLDEAAEWAQRSIDDFPNVNAAGSLRLLADLHQQAGRGEKAVRLVWDWFAAVPSLQSYSALIERAQAVGREAEYREKALSEIREMIAGAKANAADRRMRNTRYGWFYPPFDHSLLVEALMHGGEIEAARAEMEQGGCSVEVAQRLAAAMEADLPAEALAVHWRCVRSLLQRSDRVVYQQAVRSLERMADLAKRTGLQTAFSQELLKFRLKHKKRWSFLRMLDEAGLS